METCALNNLYVINTMSPRRSEEEVMTKICKSWEGQKQSFADDLQNKCS